MHMLVLGAGLQGSACAYDLLQNPDVTEVRLADIRIDHLPEFLAPYSGSRLIPTHLDVRDHDAVRALLEHNWGKDHVVKLKLIAWDDVGVKVYADLWRGMTQEHAKWLGALTADQIPADRKWFITKGAQLFPKDAPEVPADDKIGFAVHVLTCAAGAALLRAGWTIETAPGRPLIVVNGDRRIELRSLIGQLAVGSVTTEAWQEQCQSMGLTGVKLAS